MNEQSTPPKRPLCLAEAVYYRDLLRHARYAAQANAEAFDEICFAVERLGQRLADKQMSLGKYRTYIRWCAEFSQMAKELAETYPMFFSRFDALFESLLQARNDAMHSGAWARHATERAVELCIALEEAVMNTNRARMDPRILVGDHMVKTPISIEPWHPIALARQLMLTHSFSFLPTKIGGRWLLVSERAIVDFLYNKSNRDERLAMNVDTAYEKKLFDLVEAKTIKINDSVEDILAERTSTKTEFTLWLVVTEKEELVGVLSPFELM
jgi:CBS domain-containing protein